MKIAVVGTAGRAKEYASQMNRRLFESMVQAIAMKVSSKTTLISGGAAWADHIAVTLFLRRKVAGLRLHLPCEWDESKTQLIDNGESHWAKNPGHMANAYHRKFSKVIGRSSLAEIAAAKKKGAILTVHSGFHVRNTVIAQECDKTLSLTWAAGDAPTSGGSLDQWRKCTKPKEHVSLRSLANDVKRKAQANYGAGHTKRLRMSPPKCNLNTETVQSSKLSSTLDDFVTHLL
eukprot:m.14413 g.14413  ORF g.14413 m.14413 type:complete len:232 (+) comp10441_c0_seq3:241-936(+)